jgi:hypothetical protein
VHENPTPLAHPGALTVVPLHDPLTGHEEHVASLVLARPSVGEHEPGGRLKIDGAAARLRSAARRQHQNAGIPTAARYDDHALPDNREGGR